MLRLYYHLAVPTNYRIKVSKDKVKLFVKDDDEDKNLGRWVNRQRSMFQAGKLRKDRQLALENIGLKWSMLATTSWESMFETLCQYVEEKKKGGAEWDGNVPANYRTEDVPPRALGRWINRQRSAYGKNKLKPEYVAKLNEIGLKWSIHERRPTYHQYTNRPETVASSTTVPELVQSTVHEGNSSSTPTQNTNGTKPQSGGIKVNSILAASGVQKNANVIDKENQTKTIEIMRPDHTGSSNKRDTHYSESVDKNIQGVATALATAASSKLLTGVSSTELSSANEEEVQIEIPKDLCIVPKVSCPLIQTDNGVGSSAMKMHTMSDLLTKTQISSKDPGNSIKESVIVTKKATDSQVTSLTPTAGNTTETNRKESVVAIESTKPFAKLSSEPIISLNIPTNIPSSKAPVSSKEIFRSVKESEITTNNLTGCANTEITTKTKTNGRTIDQKDGSTSSLAASKVGSTTKSIGEKPVDKVTFVTSSQLEPKARATETTAQQNLVGKSIGLTLCLQKPTTGNMTIEAVKQESIDRTTVSLTTTKVEITTTEELIDKSTAASSSTSININTSNDMINQSLVEKSTATLQTIKVEDTTMDEPVDESTANVNVTSTETINERLVDNSTALSLLTQSIGNVTTVTNIKQESIDESMEA